MKCKTWGPLGVILCAGLLLAVPARAATGPVHQRLLGALKQVEWLDSPKLKSLKASWDPDKLYTGLIKGDSVVQAYRARLGKKEEAIFRRSLEQIADPQMKRLFDALVLSPSANLSKMGIPEKHYRGISARRLLYISCNDPDRGMDQNLKVSKIEQALTGGDEGPPSQGFRHMEVFYGLVGRASDRAELFFHLAQKALSDPDPFFWYWGVRFLGWALHYAQDMIPVHTKLIAHLKYLPRLKDVKAAWKKDPGELIKTLKGLFTRVNLNHHKLMEALWQEVQLKKNSDLFPELRPALRAEGNAGKRTEGALDRLGKRLLRRWIKPPGSAKEIVDQVARSSRRDAGEVVGALIEMTQGRYVEAKPGDPTSIIEIINSGKEGPGRYRARKVAKQLVEAYKARDPLVVKPMRRFVRAIARQHRQVGHGQRGMARLLEGGIGR